MTEHRPLVSVCVPTYNYRRFLPDCIESVLQQDMGDLELVVTDDCSTDGTYELMTKYARLDKRVRFIVNPDRLGMFGNFKRAAELARGRYLKMLCSDDWLAPQALGRFVELMERHPHSVLATSAVVETREDGSPLYVQFVLGKQARKETFVFPGQRMLDRMALGEGFGGNSAFFIRADAYVRTGGYDASWPYAGDYDLGAKLCAIGDYLHTDEPLFYGRRHGASSSSVNPTKLLDVQDWFDVPKSFFSPRPPFSRTWLRYEALTALLTARYGLNVATSWARGNRGYSQKLLALVRGKGRFTTGAPLLPFYAATRAIKRILGRHQPRELPIEPGMSPPRHRILEHAE